MGVIQLTRRVWCYAEQANVITMWLNEIQASDSDKARLNAYVELYETAGEKSIASSVEDIGDDLYALLCIRKGGLSLAPIFCRGPFSDLEITFLAVAVWRDKKLR